MNDVCITGISWWAPEHTISNKELVDSYNRSAELRNKGSTGEELLDFSTEAFILKASGIASRHVIEKSGILDPTRLKPTLPTRRASELSLQAEISIKAITTALEKANKKPEEVDGLIVSCTAIQRAYPSIAIEVQHAIGAQGWAYDMMVGCGSATFAYSNACDAIKSGSASCIVVVTPEITSGFANFASRASHFILGDGCAAAVIEARNTGWKVLGTRLRSHFSNNIRNDFGYLSCCEAEAREPEELLFHQNGHAVMNEIAPLAAQHIEDHLKELAIPLDNISAYWLHQANARMNHSVLKHLFGEAPDDALAPSIIAEYGNVASAGAPIALAKYGDRLNKGDLGVLCAFGAGYSIGSLILQKMY